MSLDEHDKRRRPVEGFHVKVLGGTFQVRELLVDHGQSAEDVRTVIAQVPADRWFVMVSDGDQSPGDSLAMIDDGLEFQVYAHGVLQQD